MSISVAVIDELARALGEDLPPELRDALVRIEGAERGVTQVMVTTGVTPARSTSAGAARQRRYRERLKARAAGLDVAAEGVTVTSPGITPSVTEASRVMPDVTVGDGLVQKNFPPHPPIRKYKNPKRGVMGRHRVTSQQMPIVDQIEIDASDPIFREITAMRGGREPIVGKRGVAWISAGEVAVARARMAETVRVLRPSSVAMHSAIGPPHASGTG
jgi:hypothetical protein